MGTLILAFLVILAAIVGVWLTVGGDERDEVINNFLPVPDELIERELGDLS